MTTFLCKIGDLASEFLTTGLRQIAMMDADSFEDAASKLFPNMEVHDLHPTGNGDSRLVCARFLPANEIGVTHRYETSGYFCQRFATITQMPEGWTPHPSEVETPTVTERTLKQWTLEAWCR